MRNTKLKHFVQSLVLLLAMFSLSAMSDAEGLFNAKARSDTGVLSHVLASHFEQQSSAKFIDFESVDQVHADEYGGMRYLVMDFELAVASTDLQNSIHTLCASVLQDLGLVKRLSEAGYDMISVSFDKQSQYDCL